MSKHDMPTLAPSRKVTAASAGAAVAGFILWLLDEYVFVDEAIPEPVAVLVAVGVPLGLTFLSGYFTKRGDDELV